MADYTVLSVHSPSGNGGVVQVFRNLRQVLCESQVELRWIGCGVATMDVVRRHARPEDWDSGEVVGAGLSGDRERAEEYIRQIINRKPTAVLFHILFGQIESSLAAYLPREIRRIALVHNITPATYRAVHAMRDHLDATIGVSPRIKRDLVRLCGFSDDRTFCIPNGVDSKPFSQYQREDNDEGPLRLLSCGRLEDSSKGIFWLPEILRKARRRGVDARLTVAGDGPDRTELERRIDRAGLHRITQFVGWVPRERLPHLYAEHDVFVFPSRFEGLPLALVEAAAGGCVPLATQIRGVTDFVVDHGRTGLLFPSGKTDRAAQLMAGLFHDRLRLRSMRDACREEANRKFNIEDQARAFVQIVEGVIAHSSRPADPLSIEKWMLLPGLTPAWWTSLPEPMKNVLRELRERMGVL